MSEFILLIEDDEHFRKTLMNLLRREGYQVTGAEDGYRAIEEVKKNDFALIIADVRLPGIDGVETIDRIRESGIKSLKTMIITGYEDKEAPIRAIRLGVDDYLYKPFTTEEFLHSVTRNIKSYKLEKAVEYYRELSILDGLTGLFNHRYFHEIILREINRAQRYSHPLSLLMVDIDSFKQYNDAYGYMAGERALRAVANIIVTSLRKVDLVFRYGGEEFAVILPEIDKQKARIMAEGIRSHVEQTSFEEGDSTTVKLTVSIGLAACPCDAECKEDLIEKTDKALYQAKQLGKNRVCPFDELNKEKKR